VDLCLFACLFVGNTTTINCKKPLCISVPRVWGKEQLLWKLSSVLSLTKKTVGIWLAYLQPGCSDLQ
jgi:hypothetical protein